MQKRKIKVIKEEKDLDNGLVEVMCKIENTRIILDHFFTNKETNQFEGQRIKRHTNGRLSVVSSYKNGNLDGSYTKYNNKSKINIKATYIDGKLDGEYLSYWDENNNICEASNWIKGTIDGDYKVYDSSGTLKNHRLYDMGKLKEKII